MLPSEVIRRAAEIIRTQGWCQTGLDNATVHARNHAGLAVPLYAGTRGDSRASINPDAANFSIYGAIAKAMAEGDGVQSPGLLWDIMAQMSQEATGDAVGGTNHVHPVLQYNDKAGRTVEQVLALLDGAATAIERRIAA